jgi:hypothetical protein
MDKIKSSIADLVLEKIKTGQAEMRPRWHFVLRTLLFTLGVIILWLALLYLASFIVFVLRETGVLFVPSFGFRGVGVFLFSLPWFLILLVAAFVLVLEILVTRYSFAYRKPLLYSMGGILLLVVLGGAVVSSLGFHQGFSRYAKKGSIPMAGEFYRSFEHRPNDNIFPGTILTLSEDGFRLRDPREEEFDIIVTSDTGFPFGVDFEEGDKVVVFGDRKGTSTVVQAVGIRRMDGMPRPPRHHEGWGHPQVK